MESLHVKMLSQRKGKAVMIAVDGRIKDAEVYVAASVPHNFTFWLTLQ